MPSFNTPLPTPNRDRTVQNREATLYHIGRHWQGEARLKALAHTGRLGAHEARLAHVGSTLFGTARNSNNHAHHGPYEADFSHTGHVTARPPKLQ